MNKIEVENNTVINTDNDRCYTVYMHTSPSGKRYIGITCQKPEDRWRNGNGYKTQSYFYKSIFKYGWGNFKHEVLYCGLTKEDAEQKEIELIKRYKSDNKDFGYNIEHGGSCAGKMSDETKKKLSEINKKENLSEETLMKRSAAMTGRELSDNHKERMSEVWYETHGDALCKIVHQYTKDGVFVKSWKSARYAAKELEISSSLIIQCCRGNRKTTGGFIWKYADEELSNEEVVLRNAKIFNNKKHVLQYSRDGKLICEYDSAKSASIATGVKETYIYRCCSGGRKTTGGYVWKYADNVEVDVNGGDLCA